VFDIMSCSRELVCGRREKEMTQKKEKESMLLACNVSSFCFMLCLDKSKKE